MNTDAIRARCGAATPGPWEPGAQSPYTTRFPIHQSRTTDEIKPRSWQRACICRETRLADAAFIAHARTDVLDLLDEIDRLRNLLIEVTDIPALLDEVARLRASVLARPEWVPKANSPVPAAEFVCYWCGCSARDGHAADCQREDVRKAQEHMSDSALASQTAVQP